MEQQKQALLSVFHKTGIVEFAQELVALGFGLLASGGTAKHLKKHGLEVRDVADLVGGGAILDHRVVTLSREVHAGLLARRIDVDIEEMEALGLPFIDLVCVDLYPLKEEIAEPDSTPASVIEQTDIGGPTMLRSAAKGQRIVVCDPADRMAVIDWLKAGCADKEAFITRLAAKAEFIVSDYCLSSAEYHGNGEFSGMVGRRVATCAYGENGYQTPAALYTLGSKDLLGLSEFVLKQGSAPSYNNLCDLDRLLQAITHIVAPHAYRLDDYMPLVAIAVKHGNPCGAAMTMSQGREAKKEVIKRMVAGDPLAIFGGLVMVNFEIDEELAELLLTHKMRGKRRLLDGIIAPGVTQNALDILQRKKDKCRVMVNSSLGSKKVLDLDHNPRFRYVRGGFLKQPNYTFVLASHDERLEKIGQAKPTQEAAMLFAKAICGTSNSNTITLVKAVKAHFGGTVFQLIGNGVGQQARVYAAELAVERARKAGHDTTGAVAASDSFFPELDGPKVLAAAGIKVIISTSGSVRDEAVKKFCKRNKIILWLIPDKVGRDFFGH